MIDEKLLTPAECAALWKVDIKTVSRWAVKGEIPSIKTPGGHRRFKESEILRIINGTARPLRAVDAA